MLILIADDDAATRELLRAVLYRGNTILEAKTSIEALEMILDSKPDLAILDGNMPSGLGGAVGKCGLALLGIAKHAGVRAILFTADRELAIYAQTEGYCALVKGCSLTEILKSVQGT